MAKASNEITLTRVYDAPVKAVWDAWTDPKQAAKWWGPRGFTITTHSKDLRPGGHWNYTMHGPDGTDYINKTKYFEVVPLSKLVYDHGGDDERAPLFRVTVLFSETKGKTKMQMTMALPTAEAAEETKKFIKKAGGNSTWDRLAEYLEKESSGKDSFVIARAFDAPVEKVFDMWVNAEDLAKWLPPTGMTMTAGTGEIRPGNALSFLMEGNGMKLFGKLHYLEIERPQRLVYKQQFCDEQGRMSLHPKVTTWPEMMLATVTFVAEGADCTRVTVQWEPYGAATAEEIAAFAEMRGAMTMGWTGSFDKLEALVVPSMEGVASW